MPKVGAPIIAGRNGMAGDGPGLMDPWVEERDGYVDPFFDLTEKQQDALLRKAAEEELALMNRRRPVPKPAPVSGTEPKQKRYPAFEAWLTTVAPPRFPLHVLPLFLRRYAEAGMRSIHCPSDLIAGPLLAVAGAATGRSGRRLQVKAGWIVSSCLWTACLTPSGGGKTPALNMVEVFYDERQEAEHAAYVAAKEAYAEDPEHNPKPGPYPALKLTDATIECLRSDLANGPVLFSRDELGGWCHTMGQYKSGNADRFDWCSFWSHSAVNIGRKTERVYVRAPFVAVTGMMVPASARELNYRGRTDDGFVHRMLLAVPEEMAPVATLQGVPEDLTAEYKRRMARLFEAPAEGSAVLTFTRRGLALLHRWANGELFAGLRSPDTPGWLTSKYRKLYENCLRLCLVLHELWRVAEEARDPADFYGKQVAFRPDVVDEVTVERAIAVAEYYRAHVEAVQALLGEEVDEVDRAANRLRPLGTISVRQMAHKTTYKRADEVMAVFAEWERRGYGKVRRPRKNRTVFAFGT